MTPAQITDAPTDKILGILKKRYRGEMAILDHIDMIECEVMAMDKKVSK